MPRVALLVGRCRLKRNIFRFIGKVTIDVDLILMRLGLGKIIFGEGVIIAGAKAVGVIVFLRDGGWRKVQWFLDGVGLVGGLIGGFCLELKLRLAGIVAVGAAAVLLFFTHIYYRLIKFIDLSSPFRWCLSPDCHAAFFL